MVEKLIKKHEAFEKSAATQEERFLALERLTTVCETLFIDFVRKWLWVLWKRKIIIIGLLINC